MGGMTIKEASRLCGKSEKTIRNYIAAKKLEYQLRDGKYGKEYVLTLEALTRAGLLDPETPFVEFIDQPEDYQSHQSNTGSTDGKNDDEKRELIPYDQLWAMCEYQKRDIERLQDSIGTISKAMESIREDHSREIQAKDSHLDEVRAERDRLLVQIENLQQKLQTLGDVATEKAKAEAELVASREIITVWERQYTSLESQLTKSKKSLSFRWPWRK